MTNQLTPSSPLTSRLNPRLGLAGWIPLTILPISTVILGRALPGWAYMWLLVASLFLSFKWLTWWPLRRQFSEISPWYTLAYLTAWIGMDPKPFCEHPASRRRAGASDRGAIVHREEWLIASSRMLLGGLLIWGAIPLASFTPALVIGWLGMVGLALLLHFGGLQFVALIWRSSGVRVAPIMNSPLRSESVADFWGKRWNLAFRDLSHRHLFRPLRSRLGPELAALGVFLVSGLIHEVVISLPAGGGYGLPTAYFLLQGVGMLLEKSELGRRLDLRSGVRGRCFACLIVVLPVGLLFHRLFVTDVVLPFLSVLGAT